MQVGRERQAKPDIEAMGQRLLAALRRHLIGNCASLCGDRSPDYFTKALLGNEPGKVISLARDIAQLATRPEAEARAAVSDLALTLLDAVRPSDGTLPGEAVAALLHEVTEAVSAYSRAMDDGALNLPECERILSELDDVQRSTACLRAVLEGRRRRMSA